jgi:hypothetical protein
MAFFLTHAYAPSRPGSDLQQIHARPDQRFHRADVADTTLRAHNPTLIERRARGVVARIDGRATDLKQRVRRLKRRGMRRCYSPGKPSTPQPAHHPHALTRIAVSGRGFQPRLFPPSQRGLHSAVVRSHLRRLFEGRQRGRHLDLVPAQQFLHGKNLHLRVVAVQARRVISPVPGRACSAFCAAYQAVNSFTAPFTAVAATSVMRGAGKT